MLTFKQSPNTIFIIVMTQEVLSRKEEDKHGGVRAPDILTLLRILAPQNSSVPWPQKRLTFQSSLNP
jgi:hypothetical protein